MLPPPLEPRANVLIVDDDAGVRDVCTTMLHVLGFRAHDARDGFQAIDSIEHGKDPVELVLLDLTMPDMDGATVLKHLKQTRPDVRVLVMSGRPRDDLRQFLAEGASAVLKKPFGLSELGDSIETAFSVEA